MMGFPPSTACQRSSSWKGILPAMHELLVTPITSDILLAKATSWPCHLNKCNPTVCTEKEFDDWH